MKVLGFRPTTLAAFGLGFLLGSRSGPGAWNSVMEKWHRYQGNSGYEFEGNGHGQPASRQADTRDKAAVPFAET